MGIVNYTPKHVHRHKDVPQVAREDYATITTSNRDCRIKRIEGVTDAAPWVVDYYKQQLDQDDATHHADPSLSGAYQQYCRTAKYTLLMLEPLANNEDGIALMNADLVPNVGDVVIDKGSSPWLFVRVIEVETVKNVTEKPSYKVTLREFGYTSETDVNYLDLQSKLSCENGSDGNGNVVPLSKLEQDKKLSKHYCTIASIYMESFVNTDTELLTYIEGEVSIYDHHLADFVQKTIGNRYMYAHQGFRLLHVHETVPHITIYNELLNIDIGLATEVHSKVNILPKSSILRNIGITGLKLAPVKYLAVAGDVLEDGTGVTLKSLFPDIKIYPTTNAKADIVAVNKDESYVFSDEYYAEADGLSLLEDTVYGYLNGTTPTGVSVLKLYEGYKGWSKIDKFYLTPILLLLTKIVIGE